MRVRGLPLAALTGLLLAALAAAEAAQTPWGNGISPDHPELAFAQRAATAQQTGAGRAQAAEPVVGGAGEPTYPAQVVADIPAPNNFIAGLAFDGTYLWCAARMAQLIYQVDPADGRVIKSFPTPGYHAAGLKWADGYLWHVDGRTRLMYRLDPSDGSILEQHPLAGSDPTGILIDGNQLVVSDYGDPVTYFYDRTSGQLVTTKMATLDGRVWGSDFDGEYYWFVSAYGDEVFAVEPTRWQLVTSLPINHAGATDAAIEGEYLWIPDAWDTSTPRLKKYRVRGEQSWVVRNWRDVKMAAVGDVWNAWDTPFAVVRYHLVLPLDLPNQQVDMAHAVFDPTPQAIQLDPSGQRWADYVVTGVPIGDYFQYQYAVPLRYGDSRYVVFPDQVGTAADVPPDMAAAWTGDIPDWPDGYDLHDPRVQAAANEAAGTETNAFWIAMQAHDYVLAHLTYSEPAWQPVGDALSTGTGVCDDYGRAVAALCRAKGIPARAVAGCGHVTTDVWLPGPNIWFPLDATWDDTNGTPTCLWQTRHHFGSSSRVINHNTAVGGDNWWWVTEYDPPGSAAEAGQGPYLLDGANNGPLFTGNRQAPRLWGDQLEVHFFPAFDPEGDAPITYNGYITTATATAPGVAPGFSTQSTDALISLSVLPASTEYYLRIIPTDPLGAEFSDYRTKDWYSVPIEPGFPDVPFQYWAYDHTYACVNAGIVGGYGDGTYRPTLTVTRDMMAVFISRALAGGDSLVPPGPATATFSDVATSHWAYKYVEYAVEQGVVGGYSDGTYRPTITVTRDMMAVFVARAMCGGDTSVPSGPATAFFTDVPTTHWAFRYVEYIRGEGVTGGYGDGTYRPAGVVDRASMAVYVQRAFELPM